jgi:hypothetical protein
MYQHSFKGPLAAADLDQQTFFRARKGDALVGHQLQAFIEEIPWGPIYTVQSLWVNLRGGHDVTPQAATALRLPIDKSMLYPEARKAAGA